MLRQAKCRFYFIKKVLVILSVMFLFMFVFINNSFLDDGKIYVYRRLRVMERILNRSQPTVDDHSPKRNNNHATAKSRGLFSTQTTFTSITSTQHQSTTQNLTSNKFKKRNGLFSTLATFISITPHQSTTQNVTSNKFMKRNTNSLYKSNFIPPDTFPLTLNGIYIIDNKNICIDTPKVTVLVMVHSATKHFVRRENIRTTYASRHLFKPAVIRVIFLLGLPRSNQNEQKKIADEARIYGDVIQGNFVDTYHDLTHKAVMGLRWVSENCRNAKYVIKVDDDAVFDMWKFLTEFPDPGSGKTMWCTVNNNSHVQRFGKWAVRRSQFRGLQRYPWPYCGGFVVVMNGELIPELFSAAKTSPFFWIDDVYVYGVLRHKVKDAAIKDMPKHFALVTNTVSVINCLRNKNLNCDFVAGMASEASFKTIWDLMTSKRKTLTISLNMLSFYTPIE